MPIGVNMLPRFAAIVCITTTNIISSLRPAIFNVRIANGTNVISETSFVINILQKKHKNTNTISNCLRFFVFLKRNEATASNTPSAENPPMTVIRQNSIASTRTST